MSTINIYNARSARVFAICSTPLFSGRSGGVPKLRQTVCRPNQVGIGNVGTSTTRPKPWKVHVYKVNTCVDLRYRVPFGLRFLVGIVREGCGSNPGPEDIFLSVILSRALLGDRSCAGPATTVTYPYCGGSQVLIGDCEGNF